MIEMFALLYLVILVLLVGCVIKAYKRTMNAIPEANEDFLFVEDPGILERSDLGGGYK